jgi:hypothetical protein
MSSNSLPLRQLQATEACRRQSAVSSGSRAGRVGACAQTAAADADQYVRSEIQLLTGFTTLTASAHLLTRT